LSRLFQVSTDYLLKDEIEENENAAQAGGASEEPVKRSVSVEEANQYMDLARKLATPQALAVALFVLSPVPLLLLAGLAEAGRLTMKDEIAVGLGIVILLIMVQSASQCLFYAERAWNPTAFWRKKYSRCNMAWKESQRGIWSCFPDNFT